MNKQSEIILFGRTLPRLFMPGSLFLLAIIAYSNSFPGCFLFDDFNIVADNPLVQAIDLRRIFTSDYWGHAYNSGLYRPLTILSLAINRALFGSGAWGFQLINLLLHGGVAILLFIALTRYNISRQIAWLAAAIFAVHPIHTEVVNEAVGRSELLVALFLLFALCLSHHAAWQSQCCVVLLFVAALLSKEHAFVFIALLPTLDWFSGRWSYGGWRKRLSLYIPLFLVAIVWLIWWSLGVEHIVPRSPENEVYVPLATMSHEARILTALKLQWLYLYKQFLPFRLQGIYSGWGFMSPVSNLVSLSGLTVVLASFLTGVLAVIALRRRTIIGLAFILYAISFSPTSNLIFATSVTMAERLTYLPSVWFCLGLAAVCVYIGDRLKSQRTCYAVAVILLVFYSSLTLLRNPDFSNRIRFWTVDVETDQHNILARNYLGIALADADNLELAEETYLALMKDAPDFMEIYSGYASLLNKSGRYEEAIQYAIIVAESPQINTLTNAYIILAKAHLELGQYERVLHWLDESAITFLNYPIYWELRGRALEGLGDFPEAVDSYIRMSNIYVSADSEIPLRLGNLLLNLGRHAEAEVVLRELVRKQPSAAAWNSLGISYAMRGMRSEAFSAFSEAVKLEPELQRYRLNLERSRQ